MQEKKYILFLLVATSIFMSTLDSSMVNVALPYMMHQLQTDIKTIQWVVLIYLITISSFLLSFGRLSDIKGRRYVYVLGFIIFTLGSLFCGVSQSAKALIVSRIVQGVGASMLMACSPAIIVDGFPEKERGRALGAVGAVVAAGLTIGPVAGGIILEYLSWHFLFLINIPIGVISAVLGVFILNKEDKGTKEPMDKTGSLLIVIMLSSMILFLSNLSSSGFFSISSFLLAGISFAAFIGFKINESKVSYPLFDLRLLDIKLFVFPVISAIILFAALFVFIFIMPFYLKYPCGFSASKTGIIMIGPFFFLLIVSPLSGILYDKFGSRLLCMTGMSFLLLSFVLLIFLDPSMPVFSILWRTAFAGIGIALFVSPNTTAIMNNVPISRRGVASATLSMARNLGMVIGVALASLVFTSSLSSLTNGLSLENYSIGMENDFIKSFKLTIFAGAFISFAGLFAVFARGKEDKT